MTTQTEEPRAEASLAPVLSFGELTYPALGSLSLCRGGRNLLETLSGGFWESLMPGWSTKAREPGLVTWDRHQDREAAVSQCGHPGWPPGGGGRLADELKPSGW